MDELVGEATRVERVALCRETAEAFLVEECLRGCEDLNGEL